MIDPFKYIPPSPEKIPQFEAVAESIARAYQTIMENVPEGRERSLTITKLQEARMWANAGISFGGNNAKPKAG